MSLKKILAVALCMTVVSATGAMMASAESVTINLMPANVSAITCGAGGSVEATDGGFVFKAGSADTSFTYALDTQVNMAELEYMYFDLSSTGDWDIKWTSTGLNNDVTPGFSADFGPGFGLGDGEYGNLLAEGTFVPGDVEIKASGAYTWNGNLPDDGIVTMKSIEVKLGAGAEMTLKNLYISDIDGASANPGNATTNNADAPDATTAAPTNNTTGKTNPSTGESTAMVASGIVLAVVSAGAVALTMKKKAQ